MTLLVTIAIVGFAGWLTNTLADVFIAKWKADRVLTADRLRLERDLTTDRLRLDQDRLTLDRDIFDAQERRYVQGTKHDPRPADLEARIQAWEDEWARGDERKAQDDLYAELRSWDKVRQALRPLSLQDDDQRIA